MPLSEVRGQRSEVRSQKPEARSQKPEVRSQGYIVIGHMIFHFAFLISHFSSFSVSPFRLCVFGGESRAAEIVNHRAHQR